MANETLLVLSGQGVAPYSARGLTQTLEPIQSAANTRRSINGSLKDLSQPQFRKYSSTITGNDQLAPAVDGLMPGAALTVDCIAELSYKTSGGSPSRPVVPGSSRTDGAYTYYRPRLTMKVVSGPSMTEDEYGRQVQWSLQLEEA